ncbi:phosphogluconate repressor HexR, RpiR family [Klebsiella pneumoniae]|nr:phosphogluconate repressor HexR, RpiR family [Klebsiella pneumoniae]
MSALLLMNMLEKIQSRLEHLSKSERKVAEVILATPEQAIHSSIAALALEAGVSEPTVNRFCRSLETRGFPDFKLHLAQSLAHARSMLTGMSMKTTALSHTRKNIRIGHGEFRSGAPFSLDMSAVNRAVDLLTQAKKNRLFRPRLLSGGRSRRDEQIFPL